MKISTHTTLRTHTVHMGCFSSFSIQIKKDRKKKNGFYGGKDHINHGVSLTSSTYGVLKLDDDQPPPPPEEKRSPPEEQGPPEIIDALELMKDLEEMEPVLIPANKTSKILDGFAEIDAKSPLKSLNQMGSPIMLQKFSGKENNGPKTRVLKDSSLPPNSRISKKGSPNCLKSGCFPVDSSLISLKRRNLEPLFDSSLMGSPMKLQKFSGKENNGPKTRDLKDSSLPPNSRISKKGSPNCLKSGCFPVDSSLISSKIRNLEPLFDFKKTVSETHTTRKSRNSIHPDSILDLYEQKWPIGGSSAANAVVIYTTTLRGIRKTFDDCNIVREIIESHGVRMFERDISMDLGFKEELRKLIGKKEVKVPLVLVKGRLVGGCDEIVKLEEEGKLGILLDGIPVAAASGCKGCSGEHFTVCTVCNGSGMLMGRDGKKTLKCGGCNENGLVQCPICCEIVQ